MTHVIDAASFTSGDSNFTRIDTFAGRPVVDVDPGDPPPLDGSVALRLSTDWNDEARFDKALDMLAAEPRPGLTHLIIGPWSTEMYDSPPTGVIARLTETADRFPDLAAMFFGEIIVEENEMSWIQQTDVSSLFAAFPKLEVFRVRGGQHLAFSDARHDRLRCLALETGGLSSSTLRSIITGSFPALEHLELWLGTEDYGGTCSIEDLQPLLAGNLFPALDYLGLRNCEFADDIAGVVAHSPIVERVAVLDLSLGVLTDDGAQALLSLPQDKQLRRVDLHHHYLSDAMVKRLTALPFEVDADRGDAEEDQDWRFVAIGE